MDTYEKKYKEALSKCKAYIDDTEKRWSEEFSRATEEVFKEIFPELRESEDERIRKAIIEAIKYYWSDDEQAMTDCLAYLEKQKEQKPDIELIQRSWYLEGYSDKCFGREPRWIVKTGEGGPRYEENPKYGQVLEEQKPAEKQDYSGLNDLERAILRGFLCAGVENVPVGIIKETAKECITQMKPAEWSEEDEKRIKHIKNHLKFLVKNHIGIPEYNTLEDKLILESEIKWIEKRFKSLRPSWKPSEEQMKALESAKFLYRDGPGNKEMADILESLRERLEKL